MIGTVPRATEVPAVSFDHLDRMTDHLGLFEHARLSRPRPEHAYCVDDVARALVVVLRGGPPTVRPERLAHLYLQFVLDAQVADGRFHNRRALDGSWEDEPSLEDCWGRALWGLGAAVAGDPVNSDRALAAFEVSAVNRAPASRSMAFAALGAADVLSVRPDHGVARSLLADAATLIGRPSSDRGWLWPEARLRYANAALPEVLLAAGSLLGDAGRLEDGLCLLDWLLEVESRDDHLSVAPVGGWGPGEIRPGFDQQPIEVAALADACARAYDITGGYRWKTAVRRCRDWFLGANDSLVSLYDPVTGGGCDGLHRLGRNENQGAESTLALISTFQQAARLASD